MSDQATASIRFVRLFELSAIQRQGITRLRVAFAFVVGTPGWADRGRPPSLDHHSDRPWASQEAYVNSPILLRFMFQEIVTI